MSKEDEVDIAVEKCKKLSNDLLKVIKEHNPEVDVVMSVLCQLFCKIGLSAGVDPFCMSHSVSTGIRITLEEQEEDEPDEDPKVHWASTGTQFH